MKKKNPKPIRPRKNLAELRKLLNAYHDFLDAFEVVFHVDWEMTKDELANGESFDLETAISDPDQFDGDNWANRDNLLATYGRLKQLLGERQIQSAILRDAAQEPSEPDATTEIGDLDF